MAIKRQYLRLLPIPITLVKQGIRAEPSHMSLTCGQCRNSNPERSKYCNECGTPLQSEQNSGSTEGQHLRIATVLFTDLGGYTALVHRFGPERGQEITRSVKQLAEAVITRYGGVVNQFTGDGILSLFGYPVGNDDDPARCARAALELHDAVREYSDREVRPGLGISLRLHSGFATGVILLQKGAVDGRDGLYPVTGAAVNFAARLESAAGNDQIMCCDASYRRLNDFVECEAMAANDFRGIYGKQPYWRVVRSRSEKIAPWDPALKPGLTPLVGRAREIGRLGAYLERSLSGSGQCVVVLGEAGVGKTRLLVEFRDANAEILSVSLLGNCRAYGGSAAYAPVLEILRAALGLNAQLPSAEIHAQAVTELLRIDSGLERFLPHLLDVLSITSQRYHLDKTVPGEVLRKELEKALVTALLGLSRQQSVMLVFEDWHWADDASREFLAVLLEEIHKHPILVLVLARPSAMIDWPRSTNLSFMQLDSLTRDETRAMVSAVVDAHVLPDGLAEVIFDRTDGNALFNEELARALRESGALSFADGRADLNMSPHDLVLPLSVQAAIQSRLDRLSTQTGDVLRAAAVIGRRFDTDVLSELLPSSTNLHIALEDLAARDLVHADPDHPQRFQFKHAVTQEVTYLSITQGRRRDLHARTARAIESIHVERKLEFTEQLAAHYRHAGEVDRAVHYLQLAAERAKRLFMVPEAIAHYCAAIEVLDEASPTPERVLLRIDLSLIAGRLASIYATPKVYEALLRSRELARELGDQRRLVQVLLFLGAIAWLNSQFPDAQMHLAQCLELAEDSGQEIWAVFARANFGQTLFYNADFILGIRYLENALEAAKRLGHEPAESTVQNFLGLHYTFTGRFDDAAQMQNRIIDGAVENQQRVLEQVVRLWAATRCSLQGDWASSIEMFDATIDLAEIKVARYIEGYARCGRAYAMFMTRPDAGDALLKFNDGLDILIGIQHRLAMSLYHAMYAEILALAGHAARAFEQARIAQGYTRIQEHYGEAQAYRAMAIAATQSATPNWEAAITHIETSIELADRRGQRPDAAIARFRYAEMLAKQGNATAALTQIDIAREHLHDMRMGWWVDAARNVRQRISAGFSSSEFVPYFRGRSVRVA